jgi:hypothetical protein
VNMPLELRSRRDHWQRLIPKLIGNRVYVTFADELGIRPHGDIAGFAANNLHVLIREQLPEAYRGPMPGIVFVNEFPSCDARTLACVFDAILSHELAHVVELGLTSANCLEGGGAELRTLIGTSRKLWPAHAGPVRWLGHETLFIRALCHVIHRLESRGLRICEGAAFSHKSYGLSSLAKYRASLGEELSRNSWRPIAEVMTDPLPAKTQQLWARDVSRSIKPLLKGAN